MIANEMARLFADSRITIPAYQFQAPENAPYPHIVYTYIRDRLGVYSEGDYNTEVSEVQIDIYSKANYNSILEAAIALLKEYGFYKNNGWGRFDNDLHIYFYTLRVTKEIELW